MTSTSAPLEAKNLQVVDQTFENVSTAFREQSIALVAVGRPWQESETRYEGLRRRFRDAYLNKDPEAPRVNRRPGV